MYLLLLGIDIMLAFTVVTSDVGVSGVTRICIFPKVDRCYRAHIKLYVYYIYNRTIILILCAFEYFTNNFSYTDTVCCLLYL